MPIPLFLATLLVSAFAVAGDAALCDPAMLIPPVYAPGFPAADPNLDALPGFVAPPPGYGEVPFWWWTGDPLDKDRLLWQLDKLHAVGIPGVQINYAHDPSMTTYPVEPPIFSEKWWEFWRWMTGECAKRGMGIGMSGYTIDWPGRDNLFYQLGITDGSMRGANLECKSERAEGGKAVSWDVPARTISLCAYRREMRSIALDSAVELTGFVREGKLGWTPPEGHWLIVAVCVNSPERSLDPLNPGSGQLVIDRFFQPFADRCAPGAEHALNYFFQDELNFGVSGWLWSESFAEEFQKSKGYDLRPLLPALFFDAGPKTAKVRLDYSDLMVSLTEQNYFIPIFDWHWSRGIMYACDPGSRGKDPLEFGDYFRCVRWYCAPGHDTPGGKADLIKDKVSSAMAHLYKRPRVWLEGYHSLGWGATPATIFDSSCRNFLYGASLLNLHGLYYTTHGSFWEWAPPCYHFRMPYWDEMGAFLKYFERLSYLLSQGVHVCDAAIMYPVAPLEAGMDGKTALATAFDTGTEMFLKHGMDFDFMDFQSLERAEIRDKRLCVSGEEYKLLILPAMRAVRFSTLQKALEFYRAGGAVLCAGALPEASDRAGAEDPELDALIRELFGVSAAEAAKGQVPQRQTNAVGGIGMVVAGERVAAEAATVAATLVPRDFVPEGAAQTLHRRIGARDVYMVMDVPENASCYFNARGKAEVWDAWTGETRPLLSAAPEKDGTRVRLPKSGGQAQVVVFSPGEADLAVASTTLDEVLSVETKDGNVAVTGIASSGGPQTADIRIATGTVTLRGDALPPSAPYTIEGPWEVEFKPTMDNRWGDFRLPIEQEVIGPEARQFLYAEETSPNPGWEAADLDTSHWRTVTHSFGQRFWKLGPLPETVDAAALDARLAALDRIDPETPVTFAGGEYRWQPYDVSMRWGIEGDPGPQGYHGLKEMVSDDFIALGKPDYTGIEIEYQKEAAGSRYYLWTTAYAQEACEAVVDTGTLKPAAVWLDKARLEALDAPVRLEQGANPLLLRFDANGRTHVILAKAPSDQSDQSDRGFPLAMKWYANPCVIPFEPMPDSGRHAEWFRFLSAPGLRAMTFAAYGAPEIWANGVLMRLVSGARRADGSTEYRAEVVQPEAAAVTVALRIALEPGLHAGAALPEPIALECGPGSMPLVDWSTFGALAHYSGGIWYRKTVGIAPELANARVVLDLGKVAATAEVYVNGEKAGVLLTPPWKLDITAHTRPGDNRIEVLVRNTLANHYGTIPTHYRGSPESGLIGPVSIGIQPLVTLR